MRHDHNICMQGFLLQQTKKAELAVTRGDGKGHCGSMCGSTPGRGGAALQGGKLERTRNTVGAHVGAHGRAHLGEGQQCWGEALLSMLVHITAALNSQE